MEIFEGAGLKPGRFTVTAEVDESEDGGFLAEVRPARRRRVAVGSEALVIGRLPECDVVLADSNVSRRHAELRRKGDGVFVTDLGSTNGTKVNGSPGPRAAPGQRGRDQRGVDEAHLRDVVTAADPVAVLIATQNLDAVLRIMQWGVIALIFLFFLRVDPGRLGRDEPGHHPQAAVDAPSGAAGGNACRGRRRPRARPAKAGRRRPLYLKVVQPPSTPVAPTTSTTS